ncbi:MAG: hypothetical protein PHW27_05420 [Melioribacteraceae bacterium]|nr:hypothetical protein [Melioribacteraceae bacterium]MDD3557995.1 hypothetical protein [Melioribacteraceae bacterium]
MKLLLLSLLLITSITFSQTTEIYIPDVDGNEYDGQVVKVWDANSGEYYGEQITTNSLAIFDNITSVQTEPVNYKLTAGYNPQSKSIYFTSQKSGKVTIIVSDIIGQSRKVISDTYGGREEIKLSRLGLNNFTNGFYALRIIIPSESYSLGLIKNGINYTAKNVVKVISESSLQKTTLADEIRVEVTHEGHYKRTFVAEKSERVEDYVVGFVDQMKTDGTPVTAEEFKQYCVDFNFTTNNGMGPGLKSYFPNENKEIWIAMSDKNDPSITFEYVQMEQIRDLVVAEIYDPAIAPENQPSFYLQSSVNPDEIPLYETGKIVIMPQTAGYGFGVQGDSETGVIKTGLIFLDDDLDIANSSRAREATLEEVASCLFGPDEGQGPPYGGFGIETVLVNGGRLTPIDIKLCQMAQKLPPKTQLDDVLGL